MSTPTLILPPRYTPDSNAVMMAAEQAGWRVMRLQNWRAPSELRTHVLAIYGEPLFAEIIAAELDLVLIEPPYDWLVVLPVWYVKRDIRFTSLKEARHLRERAFVKPADSKCFASQVYESGEHLPTADILPDTVPVLIAEPVGWEVECRCFVLERRVVAISAYLRNGKSAQVEDGSWYAPPGELAQAQTFIETFLADLSVPVPPAVVIDVGKIRGRGWAIVEANAAWGSGICGCNPVDILPILQRTCLRREQLEEHDALWIIEKEIAFQDM